MKEVKLTKIESKHNNLRTSSVQGWCQSLPHVGSSFILLAPPLEAGDLRVVSTSLVEMVQTTNEKTLQFKTENSTYELEILNETTQAVL